MIRASCCCRSTLPPSNTATPPCCLCLYEENKAQTKTNQTLGHSLDHPHSRSRAPHLASLCFVASDPRGSRSHLLESCQLCLFSSLFLSRFPGSSLCTAGNTAGALRLASLGTAVALAEVASRAERRNAPRRGVGQ